MFLKVLLFELRYKFKQPFTYVFWFLLFVQGVWYLSSMSNLYFSDKAFTNSGANVYIILSSLGMIGIVLASINTSTALYKDIEYRFASIVYTSQVREGTLFWARFTSTMLVNFFIFSGYVIGIIVLPFFQPAGSTEYGPIPWTQIGSGVVVFLLPNLFSMVAMAFSMTVFLRNSAGAYFAAFLYMAGMVFSESNRETATSKDLLFLLDPFGFSYIIDKVENLGALEKNSYILPIEPIILQSRLLWTGMALIFVLIARWRFSFRYFISKTQGAGKIKKIFEEGKSFAVNRIIPRVSLVFSGRSNFQRMFRLAFLETKTVVRSWPFVLISVLMVMMFVGYNLVWTEQYYSQTSQLPLTYIMTNIRKYVGFIMIIILMVYAGEMFYKDRTANIWQITDALPVPTWVTLSARFLAMAAVSFLLASLFIVSGVAAQIARGYYEFEWWLYFYDVFLLSWPKYIILTALSLFMGSLVNNRYIGHTVSIAFFLFIIVVHELEITNQTRFLFALTPGFDYSDLNRHGQYSLSEFWFLMYWLMLAGAMVIAGILIWNRGITKTIGNRLTGVPGKNNRMLLGLLVLFVSAFIACHQVIYHNVNVLNKFQTLKEENAEAADYEKKYKRFESYPQPKITAVDLTIDLYPSRRTATYQAAVWLKNLSGRPIDTLHVEYKDFSRILDITRLNTSLSLLDSDEDLRHHIYGFKTPLSPGDSILLNFSMELAYKGFAEHTVDQTDLVYNGTFLSTDILPFFGYNDDRELKENKHRLENGLTEIKGRLADPDAPLAITSLYLGSQSDRLAYRITVGTEDDQTVVTSGRLVKQWKEGARNYFTYESERPGLYNFHIASARYALKKIQWSNPAGGDPVDIEVYYHPAHHWNIDFFLKSAQDILAYGSQTFGEYPYSVLRIIEKPIYGAEANAFDNVIAIPENHGWAADNSRSKDIDYVQFLASRLISQQWFMHSGVQEAKGYPLITTALSGYVALAMFEDKYGPELTKGHLKKRTENYIKGRGKEANIEPVLLETDESGYVAEDKGGMALFALSRFMGKERLNAVIRSYLDSAMQVTRPPFLKPDVFYRKLRSAVPDSLHGILSDLFESRVLYDNAITSAVSRPLQGGYATELSISCSKEYDLLGDGNTVKANELNELLPVELLDQSGREIYRGLVRVTASDQKVTIKTDKKPSQAGVDTYHYLIDRNLGNNVVKISL